MTRLAMPAALLALASIVHADPDVDRGRYLANSVAMCVQCHSPRTEDGVLLRDQLFQGAPVPVQGPPFDANWAVRAPAIAGLPGWAEEDAIVLLMTGHRPTGETPRNPMPPFRFDRPDATAIVRYLKSLVGTP
ncbi:MAG TPA: cytochrome C [Candidatus Binatia bacterium]|jgi:mono/diheme cytochrome c family protein|nr:cytochrome C [Candidatus Binatia bacterium]